MSELEQPAATACSAFIDTITALDAFGNTATGYRGPLPFLPSFPTRRSSDLYTFTSVDAGTHTFSATLKSAGSQTLSATDTVQSTIKGTQSGISVSPT